MFFISFYVAYKNGLDVNFGFLFSLFVYVVFEIFGYVLVGNLSSFQASKSSEFLRLLLFLSGGSVNI